MRNVTKTATVLERKMGKLWKSGIEGLEPYLQQRPLLLLVPAPLCVEEAAAQQKVTHKHT